MSSRSAAPPGTRSRCGYRNIDYHLTKVTLLGHVRERLKSLVESKFAIHHRGDSVLLDEPIHVLEILTRTGLDAHDICVKTGKRQQVWSKVEAGEHADLRNGSDARRVNNESAPIPR